MRDDVKRQAQEILFGKRSEDSLISMPASFARALIKQVVYNPQKSSSNNSNKTYGNYTKENISSWLQNPTSNEKNLREASIYLYLSSQQYQRLINYYADLLIWAFVISPLNFDITKVKSKEAFKKQFLKVSYTLENMCIHQTMKEILTVALREGAFYGVRWMDSNSSFIQKLNADNCKITSVLDGTFMFSYDMSKITEEKLQFYPPCFADMFASYKSTGVKYQEVPQSVSVCLKADTSTLDYSIPPFAAVMPSLYIISNVESLQETADELRNYKMIAGILPTDDEGNPKMDWAEVERYYTHISNAIGDNVGLALTPFKLDSFNFEEKSGVSDVNTVARANANFWSSAGTSGLLHGMMNDTAGVTKLAIKNDESYIFGMMKQAERLINRYLKISMSGSIKFKITFLPITIFNRDEFIKMYKESVAFGIGKSYYLAALGIPQYDIEGLSYLEDDVLDIESKFTPLKNSHNSGNQTADPGRPLSDDDDLSQAGESTRASDSNANK